MTTRRGRQSAQTAEQTRQAILEAALALFAERGFEAVSLRDIAEQASVTHGLIRHYYGTKRQVWDAVLEKADGYWTAVMRPALDKAAAALADKDAESALAEVVRPLVKVSADHPEVTRLLLAEGARGGPRLEQILERISPLRAILARIVRGLHREGRAPGLTADWVLLQVLLFGAGPFGLSALTTAVTGRPPTPGRARAHADRVLALLLT